MNKVNVAEFKRHMGKYLRAVRNGGELVVADRDRPFAKVVPVEPNASELVWTPPRNGFAGIENVRPITRRHTRKMTSSLTALLEERSRG